jgi:hypothetical protein
VRSWLLDKFIKSACAARNSPNEFTARQLFGDDDNVALLCIRCEDLGHILCMCSERVLRALICNISPRGGPHGTGDAHGARRLLKLHVTQSSARAPSPTCHTLAHSAAAPLIPTASSSLTHTCTHAAIISRRPCSTDA